MKLLQNDHRRRETYGITKNLAIVNLSRKYTALEPSSRQVNPISEDLNANILHFPAS